MKLSEQIIEEMLKVYADEESFRYIVDMAVSTAVVVCARLVKQYSDLRIPASEYAKRLKEDTKIPSWM